MALIGNRKARLDGGYTRLFGDPNLGALITQAHSALISAGNELEKMVIDRAPLIDDLDQFLQLDIFPEGVFVATKAAMKRSKIIDTVSPEPDFAVFKGIGGKQLYVLSYRFPRRARRS